MRKLSKKEVTLLTTLCEDNELQGKPFLNRFIIRNTYEPKYKVGDFVKVTDTSSAHICGSRITNLNAVITKVCWGLGSGIGKDEEFVGYECDILDQKGEKHFAYAQEPIGKRCHPKCFITGKSETATNNFDTERMKEGDYFYL